MCSMLNAYKSTSSGCAVATTITLQFIVEHAKEPAAKRANLFALSLQEMFSPWENIVDLLSLSWGPWRYNKGRHFQELTTWWTMSCSLEKSCLTRRVLNSFVLPWENLNDTKKGWRFIHYLNWQALGNGRYWIIHFGLKLHKKQKLPYFPGCLVIAN